jgi:hypothetical protein
MVAILLTTSLGGAGFCGDQTIELLRELGKAGILYRGGRFADQEEDNGEEGNDLEEDKGGGHSIFLRLEDSIAHPWI